MAKPDIRPYMALLRLMSRHPEKVEMLEALMDEMEAGGGAGSQRHAHAVYSGAVRD